MGGVASAVGSAVGGIGGFLVGGPMGAAAGASIGGSIGGGLDASSAAKSAASAQTKAANASIAEQRRQFDSIVQMMQPYLQAGNSAVTAQQNLLGLGGTQNQSEAINALMQTPLYQNAMKSGQNSILQNASATGGLRGGNTQVALGLLGQQVLQSMYNSQLGNLANLSSLGQASAGLQANAGQNYANSVSNQLTQSGAAQAGGILGSSNAWTNAGNQIIQNLGGLNLGSLNSGYIQSMTPSQVQAANAWMNF